MVWMGPESLHRGLAGLPNSTKRATLQRTNRTSVYGHTYEGNIATAIVKRWFLFLVTVVLLADFAPFTGILVGVQGIDTRLICSQIGLSGNQEEICRTRPDAIIAIRDGAREGLKECEYQMRDSRWNCSQGAPGLPLNLFGPVMPIATKEAAFAYAIYAAGISHQLTRECSLGRLKGCGCDSKKLGGDWETNRSWRWGGCSADVQYGIKFAGLFVDAREGKVGNKKETEDQETRRLMNLHNNRAGGKIMKDLAQIECKCHGQSGACSLKTCWTTVAPFRHVGNALALRYRRAKLTTGLSLRAAAASSTSSAARAKRGGLRRTRKKDLVFLERSPSYCDQDWTRGSVGTVGRRCNRAAPGESGGCQLMCCGRGYNAHEVELTYDCECTFRWCCEIDCKTCRNRTEVYTCK